VHEPNEPLDRVGLTLEHRFHRTVMPVRHPASDTLSLRQPARRIAKEHTLHKTADNDATANHHAYCPRGVEFKELLKRRRMVRAYEPEPIPRETLDRIVATIRRAPSAGFSQGQRFVVVTDPERKRALAEATFEEFYVGQGFPPWISGAAALVVVCTREEDYHERYRQPDKVTREGEEIEWPVPYWFVDAGKAAMLVLLAAIDEGLAAGVFGVPVQGMANVRDLLGLPDDVAVVEVVTLGHPAEDTASDSLSSRGTRPRKSVDELVRWERW
jgi:nitroreductase